MSLVDQRIGNIRIESQLGAGGMGEVYAGYDEKLRRKVAVKAIHSRHQRSAEVKARFLQEARVLSQLEHPNICRIHDYIEHEGSELLVLEYIDGKPLTGKLANELERPAKLEIAQKIADVLAAAHAAGIVHRDLKPDNVMLTTDGEVKVLDFGLAHSDTQLGPDDLLAELERNPRAAAEEAVHAAILQTEIGSVLGTPAYMSPEQARGEPISAASDCYSYGLLLQELFSGKPPVVEGEDIGSVLGRAQRGERVPPEGLDGDVGSLCEQLTLVAVPERATAVQARERIQWIRGRSKRVARRVFVAIGVLVAVLATLKYTMDLDEQRSIAVYERGVALDAKDAAEKARREADARRAEAEAARESEADARTQEQLRKGQAERLLVFLMENLHGDIRKIGRLDLLETAVDRAIQYFDAVPEENLSTEELSRRAQALELLADIRFEQGKFEDMRAAAEESMAASEALHRLSPSAEREASRRRAKALVQKGEVLFFEQDFERAMEAFTESIETARQVIYANDEDIFQLGQAEFWVGYVHLVNRQHDKAGEHFRKYLHLSERLIELDPTNDDWHLEVAYGHSNLGTLFETENRLKEALAEFEQSHRIRERLVGSDPDNIPWKVSLGISHHKLGNLQYERFQLQAAHEHFREGVRIQTELVQHDPDNKEWQRELATAHSYLALTLRALGRMAASERHEAEDLRLMEELLELNPDNATWQTQTAFTRLDRSLSLLASAPNKAVQQAGQAVETFRVHATGKPPSDPAARDYLWAQTIEARVLAEAGRLEEAIERTIDIESRVLDLPGDIEGQENIAQVEYHAGLIYQRAGRTEDAERAWNTCLASFDRRPPGTVYQTVILCSVRLQLGQVDKGDPAVEQLLANDYAHPEFMELCDANGLL